MKRFFVAILALIYLATATGATVNLHYCMGELADFSLWGSHSKTCGRCGMEKSDSQDSGCCKDEQKQVKLKGDHKLAGGTYSWKLPTLVTLITSFYPETALASITTLQQYPVSHAPPFMGTTPTYLCICVFRI